MDTPVPVRRGRPVVPEAVHACAFLAYMLAGGLLGFVSALNRMVASGLLEAGDWDGVQPVLLLLAVPMLAAAGVAVAVARLPYGEEAGRYVRGEGRSRAEARAVPRAPVPGGVRFAAGCLALPALAGVVASCALVIEEGASPLGPLAVVVLAVALIRGLLRRRLWARTYAVVVLALGLTGGLITLIGLWRASIPETGWFASAPPDVGPAVLVTLSAMAVDALLLYALAWKDSSADFFCDGW